MSDQKYPLGPNGDGYFDHWDWVLDWALHVIHIPGLSDLLEELGRVGEYRETNELDDVLLEIQQTGVDELGRPVPEVSNQSPLFRDGKYTFTLARSEPPMDDCIHHAQLRRR